jgi:4-nitrophenyl phosphatase
MIMVGDRLNTDIAFGNHGGVDTLMVLTGALSFFSHLLQPDLTLFFSLAGIDSRADFEKEGAVAVPTYVVDSLGDLAVLQQ